jgi:glycosyltransferase involved in cell wall biosynthesis
MTPRVSVIIPSYNHAAFLKECLDSALGQNYADLEVILIDDCSSDDSVEIAQTIPDPRIQVRKNSKNLGAYATQNRALDIATGEYIAILNSDDIWRPGKLTKQIELLQKNPDSNLCYTLGNQIDENGKILAIDQHERWPKATIQDLLPLMLSSNRLLASSVVFRKDAVRFDESLRYSGDWVAWLQIVEKGPVLCVPDPLVGWRQHPTNSYLRSQTVTLEEIRVRRAILAAKKRWLTLRPDKTAIKKGLSECAIDLTALYVLIGQMRLAKASASVAVSLAPANTAAHKRFAMSFMPAILARKRLWKSEQVQVGKQELKALAPLTF